MPHKRVQEGWKHVLGRNSKRLCMLCREKHACAVDGVKENAYNPPSINVTPISVNLL